jgi:hypothetical protein
MTTRRLIFALGKASQPGVLRSDSARPVDAPQQQLGSVFTESATVVAIHTVSGAYIAWKGGVVWARQASDAPLLPEAVVNVSVDQEGNLVIL